MNFRLTAIFFIVVVVLVAVLMVAVWTEDEAGPRGTGLVPTLTSTGVKPGDVDTVEIQRTGENPGELVFMKSGDGRWKLTKPVEAKIDGFYVENLVRDLFQAEPISYPGRTDNPALHGLVDPTIRVTVKSGADKSATVNIGDTTIGGNEAVTFVSTGEKPNRPLAVRRTALAGLFRSTAETQNGPAAKLARWLSDFRLQKPLGVDIRDAVTDVQAIKLSTGGKDLALSRTSGGGWEFTAPAGYGEADVAGDTVPNPRVYTGVRPLLNALTNLTSAPDGFIEQPGDLADYGLAADDPNSVRIELQSRSGPTEVLYLGKLVEADGKPVSPPQVYAQLEGDPAVMKLTFDRLDMLKATIADPAELRNKDLFAAGTRDRIDALDITVGASTIQLRKVPTPDGGPTPKWVLYGGPNDPQIADQADVEALLDSLTRPRLAKDILAKPDDAAFPEPERKAVLKLWTKGFESAPRVEEGKLPAEPKPLGMPSELVFGKRDADTVYVRKTDPQGVTDYKLPDNLVALATRNRLDYIDPKFQSFSVNSATKLAFNRGGEPYEIVKAETADPLYPNGKWTFTQPTSLKDKLADTTKVINLLDVLARLLPQRVIADQPNADNLNGWGLTADSPRMRVRIETSDANRKELTYSIGNETDDHAYVYARQNDGPVVTVPKVVFDRLNSDDLVDTTLFRLDPKSVNTVKLRGWKGLTGTVLTYQFSRANGGWKSDTPPTPEGFVPDSSKINALVQSLAAPKVVKVTGPTMPAHGTAVDQNAEALEITLERPGEPPLTLTLGANAEGDNVYASSSTRPGETVTIQPAEIKKFLDKPASLQK